MLSRIPRTEEARIDPAQIAGSMLLNPGLYESGRFKLAVEDRMNSQAVADKVFDLSEQFNRYVFEHPEILDEIPDRAVLVLLNADDPEFNRARSCSCRGHPIALLWPTRSILNCRNEYVLYSRCTGMLPSVRRLRLA